MYLGSASVNASLTSIADARIPLADRGFLFGHAVFETVLVLNEGVVFWSEHLARLERSCQRARIAFPPPESLWKEVCRVVRHNRDHAGDHSSRMQLRLILTGGNEFSLWTEESAALAPNVILFCRNIPAVPESLMAEGARLHVVPDIRGEGLLDVKSNAYLPAILGIAEAMECGARDALYQNERGEFTECTTANILWVRKDGSIHTTPSQGRCLPGTTLLGVRRALDKVQMTLHESVLMPSDLGNIFGLALISATRGAIPVRAVDHHEFPVEPLLRHLIPLNELLLAEQRCSAMPLA